MPANSCQQGRAGLCPRILVSSDDSQFLSEFMSSNKTTDGISEELRSEGSSLSGTGAAVTSTRWIEGWRGCEQQVSPPPPPSSPFLVSKHVVFKLLPGTCLCTASLGSRPCANVHFARFETYTWRRRTICSCADGFCGHDKWVYIWNVPASIRGPVYRPP